MPLSITKQSNYLAQIVKLEGVHKHPNADSLQCVSINFQNVVTGMDAKDGDVYVYFPVECSINKSFLSKTNSFRHSELNENPEEKGFFDDKGRVKAVKLRGEKSCGYIVPIQAIIDFVGDYFSYDIGQEFDTINGIIICEKFEVRQRVPRTQTKKIPRISRVVEGQVHLHEDTENLRKNAYKISPEDYISVSYKVHGTSWWVSNVLAKRKLSLKEKVAKFLGVKVQENEYDIFYGSRKVVKNEYETQATQDFYDGDLWKTIMEEVKHKVPKGFTLYGECVGYTEGGQYIQKPYDYCCEQGQHRNIVYRITFTNTDGQVFDLSTKEMEEFCRLQQLNFVHLFFNGKAKDMYDIDTENHWHEEWIKRLEKDYNDKVCFMCNNKVPEEGIVVRKEKLIGFEAYKLKSWTFLEHESKLLDEEVINIEDLV